MKKYIGLFLFVCTVSAPLLAGAPSSLKRERKKCGRCRQSAARLEKITTKK